MNVVKLVKPTRDEILDNYVEIIKSEQDKGFMAFYEIAKTLKLAQDEFGLDVGRPEKTNVNKLTIKYSSFSDFCEKVEINRTAALSYVKTVEMIGFDADVSKVKTTVTALTNLAYQPKEIQEEFLPKILDGEKVKIAEVAKAKEALKALTDDQQEVIHDAIYEIAEEKRTGMTMQEREDFMEKSIADWREAQPQIEETRAAAAIESKASFAERVKVAREETIEIQEWIENAQKFYKEHGVEPPKFELEGNLIYNAV